MKTRLLISIMVCMLAGQFLMNAQEKKQGPAKEKPSMEEMVQRKADRMAMEMSLDDKTADKFRETYKEYLAEKAALRGKGCDKDCMRGRQKGKPGYISDAEVEKAIESRFDKRQKMIDRDQKILDIDMKYYTKFKKFLAPKQVIKIYELDRKPGQRPDRKPDARPHGKPADRNNMAK